MNQYHNLMKQSTSHADCNFPTLFCFRNAAIGLSVIISNEIISYPQAESTLYKRVHFRSLQEFNCVVIRKQITKHANQTHENNEKRNEKIPLSGWYVEPLDFSPRRRTTQIFPNQASKWLRQSKE